MYQRIMVPLDGSELAECVLPHVETIVKGCGVRNIIFVRVAEPVRITTGVESTFSAEDWRRLESENRAAAENYINQLVSRVSYDGVSVQSEVISGGVAESLTDYATKNGVDLIAIATHGRSGVSRWVWGSVADRILRSSPIPVLLVRSPGCAPGM